MRWTQHLSLYPNVCSPTVSPPPLAETTLAGNSCGTEPTSQRRLPSVDNSIPPGFEFHTNDFLGHSTPKRDRLLKPGPTLDGDTENSSLQLPSVMAHTGGWEPVPSSRSPSPMVLRKSPNKEEEREQRAHQVITESITTLLGKRQASKEEVVATVHNGRMTKRSRPYSKNKVQNFPSFSKANYIKHLQSSGKEKGHAVEEAEVDSFVFGATESRTVFRPVLLEPCIEDGNHNLMAKPSDDDGMRVTYEDPRQREERQRLALILGGKEESAQKPRWKRRSTRLAGF